MKNDRELISLKSIRMLIVGILVGIIVSTAGAVFATSPSQITAYLRDGFTFKVNGETAVLEKTPIVHENYTYLPVRELATLLGYDVGFADNTIMLDKKQEDVVNVETVPTSEPQTIDVNSGDWIDLVSLSEKCSVLYGPSNVTLQNGEIKVKFELPMNVKGERTITTEIGSIKAFVLNGTYHLFINDLRTIGLIQ